MTNATNLLADPGVGGAPPFSTSLVDPQKSPLCPALTTVTVSN